ncbi:MAG TPA: selenoneine synthase SenA [Burkholderiaceae bacterium]|nr:selenoneine synthase SenA [Burkholderiaceae bacterium]
MRMIEKAELRKALLQARQYTNALLDDLDDAQLRGPRLDCVNPMLWELGHVGWFQEYWGLRWRGAEHTPSAPMLVDADRWWDSRHVAHDTRWDLNLPSRLETRRYLENVLDAALERLEQAVEPDALYFLQLALYHEQMHGEAFAYTRQTCAYPAPPVARGARKGEAGDVRLAGGTFERGAPADARGFVFDNEKWAHRETVAPFSVSRRTVTQREFADFVDDEGYRRRVLWSPAGHEWRDRTRAVHPRYWRRGVGGGWEARRFDCWHPLAPDEAMVHVTRHEAEAWCRWAGRRLPSESEWEYAALAGTIAAGNVWEWTSSSFDPYPGFQADAYAAYSAPWFGTHASVRGGSLATSTSLIHPKFRNFYLPERADIFVGFRTCALS